MQSIKQLSSIRFFWMITNLCVEHGGWAGAAMTSCSYFLLDVYHWPWIILSSPTERQIYPPVTLIIWFRHYIGHKELSMKNNFIQINHIHVSLNRGICQPAPRQPSGFQLCLFHPTCKTIGKRWCRQIFLLLITNSFLSTETSSHLVVWKVQIGKLTDISLGLDREV